jgi:hypothetical protein
VPESFLGVPSPNHSGWFRVRPVTAKKSRGEKGQEGEVEVEGAA